MTGSDLRDVLLRIQTLVQDRYILEAAADDIAASVADIGPALDGVPPRRAAELLTERLQRTNNDRHLRVRFRPEGAATGFGGPDHEARHAAEAARNAGGIRQVRLLDDGIGLLQIAPYLSPAHLAEPYVRAAFTLLASASSLVIDLREGHGGTPETVALICGHLVGTQPVHLQDIEERGAPSHQYWTSPAATRIDAEVRVLISSGTFSGCEELAYNLQALGRARLIGETTGGGAHPIDAFRLTDVLELHLPIARSVNAVTGTNWEQIGVRPDIECPAPEALERAIVDLTRALRHPDPSTRPLAGSGACAV